MDPLPPAPPRRLLLFGGPVVGLACLATLLALIFTGQLEDKSAPANRTAISALERTTRTQAATIRKLTRCRTVGCIRSVTASLPPVTTTVVGTASNGRNGRNGRNGKNGRNGDGRDGRDGLTIVGRDGLTIVGRDGRDAPPPSPAPTGSPGAKGDKGDTGDTGPPPGGFYCDTPDLLAPGGCAHYTTGPSPTPEPTP